MTTTIPFPQLSVEDYVRLPEDDDAWGPVRRIVGVRHGITPARLPITVVWWQAPYYAPDCQAFTGDTWVRGFLRASNDTEATAEAREALQRSAEGRIA